MHDNILNLLLLEIADKQIGVTFSAKVLAQTRGTE